MVVGAGAHLHRFIEGVLAAILTCSGGASSKNLLGRWWMNGVVGGVHVEGPRGWVPHPSEEGGHRCRGEKGSNLATLIQPPSHRENSNPSMLPCLSRRA